jgi:hypothetical protein
MLERIDDERTEGRAVPAHGLSDTHGNRLRRLEESLGLLGQAASLEGFQSFEECLTRGGLKRRGVLIRSDRSGGTIVERLRWRRPASPFSTRVLA